MADDATEDTEWFDPYYTVAPTSAMATACRFTMGSLYCQNDPCPNPNHREYTPDQREANQCAVTRAVGCAASRTGDAS